MNQLHPDLELLAAEYDRIVQAWSNGEISPEDGAAQLSALEVADGEGRRWRINPQTGAWEVVGRAGWEEADPSTYVEPTASQVDDWARTTPVDTGFWSGEEPATPQIPDGWGADDSPGGWVPGRAQRSPVYAPGYDAYDSQDAPLPPGYTADYYDEGYEDEEPRRRERKPKKSRSKGGFEGRNFEGGATRIVDTIRGLLGRRAVQIGLIVLVVIILGPKLLGGFIGGGGRDCPTLKDAVLGDVTTPADKPVAECAVASLMMTALTYDQATGVATFGPTQNVDRRDLARSIGSAYLAFGGLTTPSPLPPDYDQLDPTAQTTPAIVTAYALRLVDAPVASGDPVSFNEAVLAVARLARAAGIEGPAGNEYEYLVGIGVIEEGLIPTENGRVSRIQLARWLVALYEMGAEIEGGAGTGTSAPTATTTTVASTTTTEETTTTTTTAPAGPTSDQVETVAIAAASGDRVTASGAVANPGSEKNIALQTATLGGLVRDGLTIRSGAPNQDDEGRWRAILEVVEAESGTVIATANVVVVQVEGAWKLAEWPRFQDSE